VRKLGACAVIVLSIDLSPCLARPALAFSLVSLEPNERENMITTCNRVQGNDRALCHTVVDDRSVVANYKRGCLEDMTLLLTGSTWARVRSLPATLSCRAGLAQAGYPVKDIMRRLTGAMEASAN
jgi:hypothetical protein